MTILPRHRSSLRALALAVAFIAAAAFTPAEASGEPHLTEDQVERFIESMAEVRTWADDADELAEMEIDPGAEGITKPFSSALQHMQAQGGLSGLETIVHDHGFESIDQWGRVGDRVVRAFMALEIEREHPDAKAELQEARREIEANPDIPEAQKEQLLQMLEQTAGAMMAMVEDVPEADRDALRPHMPRLRETLEDDAD